MCNSIYRSFQPPTEAHILNPDDITEAVAGRKVCALVTDSKHRLSSEILQKDLFSCSHPFTIRLYNIGGSSIRCYLYLSELSYFSEYLFPPILLCWLIARHLLERFSVILPVTIFPLSQAPVATLALTFAWF